MTASVADALIDTGIVANCINPGPVDTGYASGTAHSDLVEFLVSDEGEWIQGQVINSEGGFRRSR